MTKQQINEKKLISYIKKHSYCKNKEIMKYLFSEEITDDNYRLLDRTLQRLRKSEKIVFEYNGWSSV